MLKVGDTVKIIEPYATYKDKLATVTYLAVRDIVVELRLSHNEYQALTGAKFLKPYGKEVRTSEIYEPNQLLWIPNTKLGKLLYV